MKVVVDTDILSEIQRGKNAQVRARAEAHEREHGALSISVLSIFEVVQGWRQRDRGDRADAFLSWIRGAEVLDFDLECARLAGTIGGALLRGGRPIGLVDVGLAATALRHGRVLITGNVTHYGFVRDVGFDLDIVNWRDAP